MHFHSKLHNNSILTGSVDSFCLVCDSYLRSEDEAFTHTEKPIHKKNIGAAIRLEKFFDDQIIKVKKGYYCPFCNILLSTTTKVSMHIAVTSHQENKRAQMLSRLGDNIVAFEEVVITLESWHGLMDDTCVICNVEFDEDDMHRMDLGHILRLVQSKCEFGDKYVYRKVDEDSFFCLICRSVFSINEKLNHHENTYHKNHYNFGKELKNKIPAKTKSITKTTPPDLTNTSNANIKKPDDDQANSKNIENADVKNTEKVDNKKIKSEVKFTQSPLIDPKILIKDGKITETLSMDKEIMTLVENTVLVSNTLDKNQKNPENLNRATVPTEKSEKTLAVTSDEQNQSDILDRVDEFQKNGINIDFTWERARCQCCNEYVSFDSASIEQHIKEHNINKKTDTKPKLDLEKQAKKVDTYDVKIDTQKMDDDVVQKLDSKKLPQKLNNEVTLDTKKADKGSESKTDFTKAANVVEPNLDTKKQQSENTVEVKSDTKKTNHGFESKTDIKKADNVVEPKLDTKKLRKKSENTNEVKSDTMKTNNGFEPKPVTKKMDSGVKQKLDSKKQRNKSENTNEVKEDMKKVDNRMTPNTGSKSDKLKSDLTKELEKYAKANNMVVMPNEAYCPLCKIGITLTAAAMNEHANLGSHKAKKLSENGLFGKRTQTSMYTNTIVQVESNLGHLDVILNNKYVLRQNSFHCILIKDDGYKCMLCDAEFKKASELLTLHTNGPDHKNKIAYCKVVSSLPGEFIREIKSDIFHCGYCNEVFDGWAKIQYHLSHPKHHCARRHALWNLERCQSIIRNNRPVQVSSMHAINYA